ncbi:EF-P 5-aminopentanol modification-associated protein YfmF [Porcipelethomonas sp.]|uniref:EF-P 5-aminopentanol modification-associated protein YfmF n=1 Tax=Porcipelethomonas sp. TaxID=2981675 RepID=UPI003EF8D68E
MASYSRKLISEGIGYSTIIDPKFKTNKIQVMFITDLREETAAANAMAVGIMASSNSKYKNISEITAKLNSLYGANINADISKQGDFQRLSLGVTSIHNRYALDGEDISGEVLDILLDCIFSPNVKDDEFAREPFDFRKKDLLDTIDAEINNKRGYAVIQAHRLAFQGENSENSSYGTRKTAETVTPRQAYEAYKKLLSSAQIEIYFVGPEEDKTAEQKITEAFSKTEHNISAKEFYKFSPVKNEVLCREEKLDVSQCKMVMAFKSDCHDRYAMKLMNTIFGGTPFSKLFLNVREKLSLCYYCASGYSQLKGAIFIDCGIEEENIEKTKQEILNQLEQIKNGSFTDDEVNNSILSIVNSLKGVGDTTASYINWYYGCFVNNEILKPSDTIERYKAVTREQIIEAAKSLKLDSIYIMKGENK